VVGTVAIFRESAKGMGIKLEPHEAYDEEMEERKN